MTTRSKRRRHSSTDDSLQALTKAAMRDRIAFWLCGCLNNIVFVVYLSAAEDLLETKAGVILLLSVLPGLVTKAALPFFAERLSYLFRIALTSIAVCVCCLGVALSRSTSTRLFFLGLSSCLGSLGEVTFLALTSRYDASTIGSWSSGTGFAGVSGAGVYYFIRSIIGLTSKQALVFVSPVSLLMLVTYLFVLPAPTAQTYRRIPADIGEPNTADKADNVVQLQPGGSSVSASASASNTESEDEQYREIVLPPPPPGVSQRRAMFPWLFFQYILPLMLVYFSEYVINQGIAPTLDRFGERLKSTSSNNNRPLLSAVERSKLYTAYQMTYQVGVFISRSSIEYVKFPRIWLLPPAQLGNCVVLLIAALYSIAPNRYVVMAIIFFEGLVGGGMYVNAFYKLRRTLPPDVKAWALGTAGVGDAAGVTIAAFVNIWLECAIRHARGEPQCHAPQQASTSLSSPDTMSNHTKSKF